jgi:hypothetical protein
MSLLCQTLQLPDPLGEVSELGLGHTSSKELGPNQEQNIGGLTINPGCSPPPATP